TIQISRRRRVAAHRRDLCQSVRRDNVAFGHDLLAALERYGVRLSGLSGRLTGGVGGDTVVGDTWFDQYLGGGIERVDFLRRKALNRAQSRSQLFACR